MARLALEVLGKPVAIVLLRGGLEKVPEYIYLSKFQIHLSVMAQGVWRGGA